MQVDISSKCQAVVKQLLKSRFRHASQAVVPIGVCTLAPLVMIAFCTHYIYATPDSGAVRDAQFA